MHTQNALLLAA